MEDILKNACNEIISVSIDFHELKKYNISQREPMLFGYLGLAETILNLILRSFLRFAYVRFIEWTYEQESCIRISCRCEIYESQINLNLHAIEWFQLSAF